MISHEPVHTTAIVRPPGESFTRAVSKHPERTRIDPERARAQHSTYCALLSAAGLQVVALPPDEAHPDSCFTQDPVVVIGRRALVGRFGEESRKGEEASIEAALLAFIDSVDRVAAPATLEGGDIIRLGSRLVVGRSRRTNDAGIQALRSFAEPLGYEVRTADVPAWALHLQTAATAVGDGIVLGSEEVLAQAAFADLDRVVAPQGPACNVLTVERTVIAAGHHPVHGELQRRGFRVHDAGLGEFLRADGSPTCLSLLVGAPPAP